MKTVKTVIFALVSLVLIVLLLNPEWLPVSDATASSIRELERQHMLIQGNGQITLAHIATLVLCLCTVWLCYTVIKLILRAIGWKDDRSYTIANLLCGVLKYLAVIVAIVWGLGILGVNMTAVLAGVGLLGLILGFGAQSLVEDIITGIFIIFEGQYGVGDVIILDDFRGVVRSIGVRTTVIQDLGGNLKIVNNSDIRNLQNRSRAPSVALCDVSVSYETDLKRLERMLAEELPKMYEKDKKYYLAAPKYLGVESLGDSGVNLRFAVNVKEKNVFDARRRLNRDIRVLFQEKGVEIPFPQVVVHRAED